MSQFRRVYPSQGRILLDGGLNNKFERSIIADGESPDCANVVFSNGAVETRQGASKVNTTAVASAAFDGLYTRRDADGSETMCAWVNGHMLTLATTTFVTIPSAQSVFTAGVRVCSAQYNDYMFIGNGGVVPYKWNGAEFTRHGVYAPTTTSTVASQATGVLTGDYRYKVTARNSALVESDLGPVTATFAAASATLRITSIPVFAASYGVNARRLYRTVSSGSTFLLVTTISDNSTTSYDDNTADGSLSSTAPSDNGVPPNYNVVIYHHNRLFMNDPANPNYVWYSELGQPYTVASTNFFKVGDNTTDLVKGFGVYENGIVIYCEKSIWINYMVDSTPSNWRQVRARSPHGSVAPFAILDYQNKQMFPAVQNDKFVGFGGLMGDVTDTSVTSLSIFTTASELKSDRIETDMFSIQEAYLGNISGIIYKNKAYFAVTYGSGNTTNNRIYVYDFSIQNLTKKNKAAWVPWTGLNAAQFTIYNGDLYYGTSAATGFLYKLESGVYSDDGTAIDSYFWTKEFSGHPADVNYQKDFRYCNLLIEKAGAYYMNVLYRTDSDSGSGYSQQVSLDPGGSLWNTMQWGRDVWGGGNAQEDYRLFLGGVRGTRIQLKFTNQNTVNQRFKVHGVTYAYNKKGMR